MVKRKSIYHGPTTARRQADETWRHRQQAKGIHRIALPLPADIVEALDSIAARQGFTGQTAQRRAQAVGWMIEKLGLLIDDTAPAAEYSRTPQRL